MKRRIFSFLIILLTCSSCIEIIDDIILNSDGSGKLKYTINLSSSKVKINSILALDTLKGRRVPKKDEINRKIDLFKKILQNNIGMKNVEINKDFNEYIFVLSCEFSDIYCLQESIYCAFDSIEGSNQSPLKEFSWIDFHENNYTKSLPELKYFNENRIDEKEEELLKNGSYTSISRFDREIEHYSNDLGRISKSKKAYMIKIEMDKLIENEKLLESEIKLSDKNP